MAATFKPIIRWAQSKERLFLTLELTDVQYPTIELTSSRLVFQGFGHGARGEQQYHVDINFYKPVDITASSHKVLERCVEFSIAKLAGGHGFWPRLIVDEQKPAWLKVNFDRWQSEEISDSEKDEEEQRARLENLMAESKAMELDLDNEIEKTKKEVFRFIRTFYLVLYNLMQAGLFLYITSVLLLRVVFHGGDAFSEAYEIVIDVLASCQLAAFLEIIHPLGGIVKTGVMAPFMQVFGRNLVLFLVLIPNEELHKQAVVFGLFFVWSIIEVIRYPFYACQVVGIKIEPLIWLRYTMWIPLYPLGILFEVSFAARLVTHENEHLNFKSRQCMCWLVPVPNRALRGKVSKTQRVEGILIWRSIPLLDESKRFCISLPNMFNFGFNFAWFLRVYLALLVLGGLHMMRHMFILRQHRYGKRKTKTR